jgi:uncharacterized protein YlxP (DUF503 family)
MPVAQLTLEIRIEHAQSLKDRRQVVRSLKDQLRQGFNISVAELDEAVLWQSATIGIVGISRSRDYLHGMVEEIERAARRILNEHGAELADSSFNIMPEASGRASLIMQSSCHIQLQCAPRGQECSYDHDRHKHAQGSCVTNGVEITHSVKHFA